MIRTMLVPFAQDIQVEPLLDGALRLAAAFKSHIRAVFVRPDPSTLWASYPEVLGGTIGGYAEFKRHIEERGADQQRLFQAWCRRNDLPIVDRPPCTTASASCLALTGDIEAMVTRYGRVSDLIVVQRPTPGSTASQLCFDAAVFGSGRPALVLPEALPGEMTNHIIVAWNGSLEATRSVAAALPLLHAAKRVTIFTAREYGDQDSDLGDLGDTLQWHGITTPEVLFPDRSEHTGRALLDAAERQQASMIVMGAYTHSRMRQTLLGGVTRHVLGHAQVPLVMCH